jgi:hypothetical protein
MAEELPQGADGQHRAQPQGEVAPWVRAEQLQVPG